MRKSEGMTDWCLLRHDDTNLYLGFFDTPRVSRKGKAARWKMRATERDSSRVFGDHFYGVILTDERREKIVQLVVSASGAKWDALSDDLASKDVDPNWNGAWQAAVLADDEGFRCEMAVPRKTLAGVGLDVNALRINLCSLTNGRAYGTRSAVPFGPHGKLRCQSFIPLGLGERRRAPDRSFRVRLHFAEPDNAAPDQRVFDVKMQDQTVLDGFDIVKAAGGRDLAVVKEFNDIRAGEELKIVFVPRRGDLDSHSAPILCGVQVDEATGRP